MQRSNEDRGEKGKDWGRITVDDDDVSLVFSYGYFNDEASISSSLLSSEVLVPASIFTTAWWRFLCCCRMAFESQRPPLQTDLLSS